MFASRTLAALLLVGGVAHAQSLDGAGSTGAAAGSDAGAAAGSDAGAAAGSDGGAPAGAGDATAVAPGAHAGSPIAQALDEFDFGAYEAVVTRLRPLVDNGARDLPQKADRLEALRVYGIACTLTDRKTAAEGAFLLLLREEPSTRLDGALVRPEAVAFFDEVRARHRDELLDAYRKTRPRYYWLVDVIPLAGQIQNRQWKKAAIFGSVELALLATTIVSFELLNHYQGDRHDFMPSGPNGPNYTSTYDPLRYTNYLSFAALLTVTAAGIVDGFVVGARRKERERQTEARLGL